MSAPDDFDHRLTPERRPASRLDAEVERLRRSPTPTQGRPDPAFDTFNTGAAFMGIFNRARDIFAANFNELLDKADDPAKMIRMIILEMEETLVEVRASAARTIADQKEMHRHTVKLDKLQADWADKAQLALSKDREDLARAALVEKKKAGDMADQLKQEIAVLDDALRAYEQDIEKLQVRYSRISIQDRGKRYNLDLLEAVELGFLLELAKVMSVAALHRKESRGGHFREDFPNRDDENFMVHSMVYEDPSSPTAGIRQETKPVIMTRYEPMERKY